MVGVADLDLGIKDGTISADVRLGFGAIVGGELDLGFTLNLPEGTEMGGNSVLDILTHVKEWFSGMGDAGSDFVQGAMDETGQAADIAGDVIEDLGEAISDTAEAVGDWVADVADW